MDSTLSADGSARIRLRELSHEAWADALRVGRLDVFMATMDRPVARYRALYTRRSMVSRCVAAVRARLALRSRLRRLWAAARG